MTPKGSSRRRKVIRNRMTSRGFEILNVQICLISRVKTPSPLQMQLLTLICLTYIDFFFLHDNQRPHYIQVVL